MPWTQRLAAVGLLLAVGISACGGAGAATPSSVVGTPSASRAAATAAPAATGSSGAPAGTTSTVNANTATVEELQAAFAAAGISNADRWAREVAEYRPYPSDPTWAQLRQELGKYNIDPAVLEQIIALLEV